RFEALDGCDDRCSALLREQDAGRHLAVETRDGLENAASAEADDRRAERLRLQWRKSEVFVRREDEGLRVGDDRVPLPIGQIAEQLNVRTRSGLDARAFRPLADD